MRDVDPRNGGQHLTPHEFHEVLKDSGMQPVEPATRESKVLEKAEIAEGAQPAATILVRIGSKDIMLSFVSVFVCFCLFVVVVVVFLCIQSILDVYP